MMVYGGFQTNVENRHMVVIYVFKTRVRGLPVAPTWVVALPVTPFKLRRKDSAVERGNGPVCVEKMLPEQSRRV